MLTDEQVEYARNAILIAYQGESDNHKKCRATINALCGQAKAANKVPGTLADELVALAETIIKALRGEAR